MDLFKIWQWFVWKKLNLQTLALSGASHRLLLSAVSSAEVWHPPAVAAIPYAWILCQCAEGKAKASITSEKRCKWRKPRSSEPHWVYAPRLRQGSLLPHSQQGSAPPAQDGSFKASYAHWYKAPSASRHYGQVEHTGKCRYPVLNSLSACFPHNVIPRQKLAAHNAQSGALPWLIPSDSCPHPGHLGRRMTTPAWISQASAAIAGAHKRFGARHTLAMVRSCC